LIVFLYGRDSYRLKQNLDKIIAEYQKKSSGVSLAVLDFNLGAENNPRRQLEKLTDLIKTISFFNEKRLIVLKGAFLVSKEVANLVRNWGLTSDKERVLVFVENLGKEELTKKDKSLFNLLAAKPNIVKSFEPLTGKKLENWLIKEVESLGGQIGFTAVNKLISYVVNSSGSEGQNPTVAWRLRQEIEKLVNYSFARSLGGQDKFFFSNREETKSNKGRNQYSGGSRSRGINLINVEDVELMVGPNISSNIFELVDAIADKNQRRALRVLYSHLESGADPYYIFSMIVYQFRNLLKVKELVKNALPYTSIVKKTGLHPYVVKKTFEQCKRFDLEELKRLFNQLARLDIETKSGKIDMTEGLYQFVFSLNSLASAK
jgi:DNA polymerase-3 subunit delta